MKSNMTLVEKAMACHVKIREPHGGIEGLPELAIAWAESKVRLSQVRSAIGLGSNSGDAYTRLAMALREAVRRGLLVRAQEE